LFATGPDVPIPALWQLTSLWLIARRSLLIARKPGRSPAPAATFLCMALLDYNRIVINQKAKLIELTNE
jgi:hypothetical protein